MPRTHTVQLYTVVSLRTTRQHDRYRHITSPYCTLKNPVLCIYMYRSLKKCEQICLAIVRQPFKIRFQLQGNCLEIIRHYNPIESVHLEELYYQIDGTAPSPAIFPSCMEAEVYGYTGNTWAQEKKRSCSFLWCCSLVYTTICNLFRANMVQFFRRTTAALALKFLMPLLKNGIKYFPVCIKRHPYRTFYFCFVVLCAPAANNILTTENTSDNAQTSKYSSYLPMP